MGESVIFTGIWGIIGKEKAPNGVGLIETLDVFKSKCKVAVVCWLKINRNIGCI